MSLRERLRELRRIADANMSTCERGSARYCYYQGQAVAYERALAELAAASPELF